MGTGNPVSSGHPGADHAGERPAASLVEQQSFEALVRNSPLAVIEWDSGRHVVKWTGAAARMFGWEASEVLGKRVDEWRFVHEGDWEPVRTAMSAMELGENCISRNRNYRKDGALIYCEWYNSVLLDQTGVYRGGLSLVLYATDRRHSEEALQVSEEKYRQIVETAPVGIFRSTVEGRLLSVNSKRGGLFGYDSREELVTSVHSIGEQLYVDPQQRRAIVGRVTESDEFIRDDIGCRRRDGSTFLCTLSLRAVRDGQGRLAFLEGFLEDITERRRAEESIREAYDALERRVRERTAELSAANERLQELDRLKSQFLASMSHELRTPLNSIIGFTSLLRQGLPGAVNAEQKKQLDIVQTSASHLLALINDLLDVSRIEAGRADLEREPFDFVDLLEEVLRSLQPMADRKGLR